MLQCSRRLRRYRARSCDLQALLEGHSEVQLESFRVLGVIWVMQHRAIGGSFSPGEVSPRYFCH